MFINTNLVSAGHSELSQKLSRHMLAQAQWPDEVVELSCRAVCDRNSAEIYLSVSFEGSIDLACARCLATYRQQISGSVVVILVEKSVQHRYEGAEEHTVFVYDSQQPEVSVLPAVYDEFMTELPMKPLCSPQCPGITPTAAEDAGAPVDPRWDALRKLQ
jgi:uncharacterized protein